MIDRVRNTGIRSVLFALLALAAAAILIPAGVAQAKVKVKDGTYYQAATKKNPAFAYVSTLKGKVNGAGMNIKFKNKKGAKCVPTGFYDYEGYVNVNFQSKPVRPNGSGKFTIKPKKSEYTPGLKGTIKGKFKSSTKASLTVNLTADGCTAKGTFSKAVYTLGG